MWLALESRLILTTGFTSETWHNVSHIYSAERKFEYNKSLVSKDFQKSFNVFWLCQFYCERQEME